LLVLPGEGGDLTGPLVGRDRFGCVGGSGGAEGERQQQDADGVEPGRDHGRRMQRDGEVRRARDAGEDSEPDAEEGSEDGFLAPMRLGAGRKNHVEDIEIASGTEFEGESGGDEPVLGPLMPVDVADEFVADKDAGERADRLGQCPGGLEPVSGPG